MADSRSPKEQDYDRSRAGELVWQIAKEQDKSPAEVREKIKTAIVGEPQTRRKRAVVSLPPLEIFKEASEKNFIRQGTNLEMRWEAMAGKGYCVPNELFFVRNNSATVPQIDVDSWRLELRGSALSNPISFSYDELTKMPSTSVIRAIECAGNGRNFFQTSHGVQPPGTPWNLGAIGVAEWTGVPLSELLDRAGLKKSARDVMPIGLDSKGVSRPIPIEKALLDDTLVVYAMNGTALEPDHGYPVRMLVPGWVGIANIKWVGRIEVARESLYSEYNTSKYVLIGPEFEATSPALGKVLTTQEVKSAFELPWDGEIAHGRKMLTGRSWSGSGSVARVDISIDGGAWRQAQLIEPNIELAWVQWLFEWDAKPGRHLLRARATDSRGNTQPDSMSFNQEGYCHWAVVDHPINVH